MLSTPAMHLPFDRGTLPRVGTHRAPAYPAAAAIIRHRRRVDPVALLAVLQGRHAGSR